MAMNFPKIEDIKVKNRLIELAGSDNILGFLLQGSRVTGFGAQDSDYDIIIYCTDEYYQNLTPTTIIESIIEEQDGKKRQVGDFAYMCDEVFQQQKDSPMDIDHVPYLESKILLDKTGKLTEWVNILGFVEDLEFIVRLKMQMVQLAIAYGYISINKIRNRDVDVLVNIHRFITIAVTTWFTLRNTWTPQLKWWSDHVKALGMEIDVYNLYITCFESPNYDNITALYNKLKEKITEKGIQLDLTEEFISTIMPSGRPNYIRHSYF